MRITDEAADAILGVMSSSGLDPNTTYLEVGVFEGNLGLGFTQRRYGRKLKFGGLSVVVADNIDTTGVLVDVGEHEGRKGLVFKGEEVG